MLCRYTIKRNAQGYWQILFPICTQICLWMQTCRSVRTKAFKYLAIYKAFALLLRTCLSYFAYMFQKDAYLSSNVDVLKQDINLHLS